MSTFDPGDSFPGDVAIEIILLFSDIFFFFGSRNSRIFLFGHHGSGVGWRINVRQFYGNTPNDNYPRTWSDWTYDLAG